MRKVLRKVKSQWAVVGIMGATVVALGTANVPGVSAEEVDGQIVTETSDTNTGIATTYDSESIQEATVLEVSDLSAVSNPYDFYDWYESMGVDSYANGMRFYIDGLDKTIQLYVKTANDTGELYLTITQMGATVAEDVILIENHIIKPNTYYIFAEGQDVEPVYFSITNRNADNYVMPEYNRFEEVSDESVDPSNIKSYSAEPSRNAYDSEGLHFYESEGKLIGEAVIYVEMLGSYAPSAGGEIKYDTVYKFVDDNNEIEYFKVVNKTPTTDSNFSQIISETAVDYAATVSVENNAINTQPWNTMGWQNTGNSSGILGQTVEVSQERVTDYGVTWALISLNGQELGWIAKDALTVQIPVEIETETYSQIVSETIADYPATISRNGDGINTQPWNVKGWQTVGTSATYVDQTVEVSKEQVTDYGVTWALVSRDGQELGWIAKDALTVRGYAQIVSETPVEYSATISRGTDAINTAPWGTKGYQTISTSAAYAGQTVEVTKEQTTDYGVTWAQISLNGENLGWIAKDALTAQTYAQVTKETVVAYSATIDRDSDAINTAPWGTKGYQTRATSAAYAGQTVEVTKEQETDYGVTWAQISLNGEVLGWIAKDALKVQTYAQITEETAVDYSATISRDTDAINTAPWGTKGYQTLASSADYSDQTVEITKEQTTDYGVTWAQISLNGEVLGWIAKDALTVQTYATIISETDVNYSALISRGTDAINTAPWGTKGYQTVGSSADYVGKTVEIILEQVTDYGVTWAQISLNGEVLGWIAKDALTVEAVPVTENPGNHEEAEADVTKPTVYYFMDRSELSVDPLTVYIETEDLESGIESIILPDGTVVSAVSASFTAVVNGNYVVKAIDKNGNIQEVTVPVTLIGEKEVVEAPIDFAAPEVFYTLSEEGTTTGPITVKVTAQDVESNGSLASGVKSITLPDGTVVEGDTAQFEVSENGRYVVLVEDNDGNIATENVDIFGIIEEEEEPVYVDSQNPDGQLILSTSAPTTGPININVVATDDIDVASITLPDGTVVNGDVANFVVDKNDYYSVKITDTSGNYTYVGVNITNIQAPASDYESPEMSYEVLTKELSASAVDVVVTATDNVAVDHMIAADGTIIPGNEYRFTVTKNGIYIIQAVDAAGNTESINVEISNAAYTPAKPTEDTTAPVFTFIPTRSTAAAEPLVVDVHVLDEGGVASVVTPDGATKYGTTFSYTFYENGTYTFKATDKNGNETITTYEVNLVQGFVDKVGPTITYTVSDENPTEDAVTVYVNIVADDFDYAIAPDGTVMRNNEFSFNVSNNGFSDLVAYDKSGNESRLSIPTFNIDKNAPNVGVREASRTAASVTYRLIAIDDVGIASITRPDGTTENMSSNKDADFMEMMTFTENGTYTLSAVDYFGKESTTTFVVDSLPE